jgi:hypothetical protein
MDAIQWQDEPILHLLGGEGAWITVSSAVFHRPQMLPSQTIDSPSLNVTR